MKHYVTLIVFAASLLAACNNVQITVSPELIETPYSGGDYTVHLTANEPWQTFVKGDASWFTISPDKGDKSADIQVHIDANMSDIPSVAVVTFYSGSASAELIVGREGKSVGSLVVSPAEVNCTYEGGEFELTVTSNITWEVNSNVSWVTYSPGVGKNNGKVTLTISPNETYDNTFATITVSERGNSDNRYEVSIKRTAKTSEAANPNSEYVYENYTGPAFTVGENGRRVVFAKGNVQYFPSTDKWQLAQTADEIIGDNNVRISDTYFGWIDLFGWGTANNPTLHTTDNGDYVNFNDFALKIQKMRWYTMSIKEWKYLLESRDNAKSLYNFATINNTQGLLILPDEINVESIKFTSDPAKWKQNAYSPIEWMELEDAGAVFIPAAGSRDDITYKGKNTYGYYWTSSSDGTDKAYALCFSADGVSYQSYERHLGFSSRVVRRVK